MIRYFFSRVGAIHPATLLRKDSTTSDFLKKLQMFFSEHPFCLCSSSKFVWDINNKNKNRITSHENLVNITLVMNHCPRNGRRGYIDLQQHVL